MSTPELIEFDSATLVTYVLVTVADGWLADPAISLEIETVSYTHLTLPTKIV